MALLRTRSKAASLRSSKAPQSSRFGVRIVPSRSHNVEPRIREIAPVARPVAGRLDREAPGVGGPGGGALGDVRGVRAAPLLPGLGGVFVGGGLAGPPGGGVV